MLTAALKKHKASQDICHPVFFHAKEKSSRSRCIIIKNNANAHKILIINTSIHYKNPYFHIYNIKSLQFLQSSEVNVL